MPSKGANTPELRIKNVTWDGGRLIMATRDALDIQRPVRLGLVPMPGDFEPIQPQALREVLFQLTRGHWTFEVSVDNTGRGESRRGQIVLNTEFASDFSLPNLLDDLLRMAGRPAMEVDLAHTDALLWEIRAVFNTLLVQAVDGSNHKTVVSVATSPRPSAPMLWAYFDTVLCGRPCSFTAEEILQQAPLGLTPPKQWLVPLLQHLALHEVIVSMDIGVGSTLEGIRLCAPSASNECPDPADRLEQIVAAAETYIGHVPSEEAILAASREDRWRPPSAARPNRLDMIRWRLAIVLRRASPSL